MLGVRMTSLVFPVVGRPTHGLARSRLLSGIKTGNSRDFDFQLPTNINWSAFATRTHGMHRALTPAFVMRVFNAHYDQDGKLPLVKPHSPWCTTRRSIISKLPILKIVYEHILGNVNVFKKRLKLGDHHKLFPSVVSSLK